MSQLYSVEVFQWGVPENRDWFFALGILAFMLLCHDVFVEAFRYWLCEGKCGMKSVRRLNLEDFIAEGTFKNSH